MNLRQRTVLFTLAAAAAAFPLTSAPLPAVEDRPAPEKTEERIPTIIEIMQQSHRCRNSYINLVRLELKKETTDWTAVEGRSHDLIRMGKYLARNTPPKGTAESWSQLTSVYVAHATLLHDAARKQDKTTATTHQTALLRMCITCHRAHR